MTNSTTPVEKKKRSRVVEYLAVAVVLAVVVLAAMYQEQLSSYIRLKMWDKGAPGRAVEQMLTAGKNGDQQTVRRLLGTEDYKDLTDSSGKWRGLFMVTQAGTLDFYMEDLAPAGEIKAKEVEFFTIGKGHAEVRVPDSAGKLVKYRVEIVDGEWKVTEILAGKPRAASPPPAPDTSKEAPKEAPKPPGGDGSSSTPKAPDFQGGHP